MGKFEIAVDSKEVMNKFVRPWIDRHHGKKYNLIDETGQSLKTNKPKIWVGVNPLDQLFSRNRVSNHYFG